MSVFTCPFCQSTVPITKDTASSSSLTFQSPLVTSPTYSDSSLISVKFLQCPQCEKISVQIIGKGTQYPQGYSQWFFPPSKAKQFPDYVPGPIREDYEEAFSILSLSPKASATLSRRCIQGMIRDKWQISKKNLFEEITELKPMIDPELWKSLDATRQLGNIGAHMEKDVNTIVEIDEKEAETLILLIEILIKDWYITPYERSQLFASIQTINDEKQNQRQLSSQESSS